MKWTVGSEHDEIIFKKLSEVLKVLGFDLDNKWSGVGGSQEVTHWELTSNQGKLIIEAETYVGLSVEGEPSLVERVKNEFQK